MISPDYGSKIVLVAKALGMNQREFAKALPVSYSTLRNYTENSVMPPIDFLRKLLVLAPNLNQMWLFFDKGDMFTEDQEKRIMEAAMRENELYRKLEAEREKNMKVDTTEMMDVFRRNHSMLGSLEQGLSQLREEVAVITKKRSIST